MKSTVDAAYFREKVQMCLRLAVALSWNNAARYQLLLLAEDFQKRENEFEAEFRHELGLNQIDNMESAANKKA